MRFRFIDQAKKEFPAYRLCHLMGVSQSGYPGKHAPPVVASVMIWSCWHISAQPIFFQMKPMAAHA